MSDSRPTILITNDDGYDAAGIEHLTRAMQPLGRVVVVAPDRERSGASHSLTLHLPLRITRAGEDRYRVDGVPTDCVHLAIPRLTGGRLPDLVVSGINRGLNIGDDVTYSGTVAGAIEGTLLHVPSVAFSADLGADGSVDYAACEESCREVALQVLERGLPDGVLLNVNFPLPPWKGRRITRQGSRTYRATSIERLDPNGRPYYWIDTVDATVRDEHDADHTAIDAGQVSITPLHVNLTHEASLDRLTEWPLGWTPVG